MAALLVGIAVMGVMLSVAMPSWRTLVRREREEELIFRGEQYARAVGLYQRKFAAAYPPTVDILIQQKFLRKRYTDPMTRGEKGGEGGFVLLYQNSRQTRPGMPGGIAAPGVNQPGTNTGTGAQPATSGLGQSPRGTGTPFGSASSAGGLSQPVDTTASSGFGTQLAGLQGGIVGVASKSKEKSIRLYNGRSVYEQWQFVWNAGSGPGSGSGGAARPGQQGTGRGPGRGGTQPTVPPTLPNPRR